MPRFVVLEHTWNGRHFDWMFEHDGLLATWRIDAPFETQFEAFATRLADHRLAYLDYEGPVSRDRGSVRRVASGEFDVVIWSESRIEIEITGSHWRDPDLLAICGSESLADSASTGGALAFDWEFRLGKRV